MSFFNLNPFVIYQTEPSQKLVLAELPLDFIFLFSLGLGYVKVQERVSWTQSLANLETYVSSL